MSETGSRISVNSALIRREIRRTLPEGAAPIMVSSFKAGKRLARDLSSNTVGAAALREQKSSLKVSIDN